MNNLKTYKLFPADGSAIKQLTILSNGNLVSLDYYGYIILWNTHENNKLKQLNTIYLNGVTVLASLPNAHLACASQHGTITIWDTLRSPDFLKTKTLKKSYPCFISCLIFLPSCQLVSGCNDGTIDIWDPYEEKLLVVIKGHAGYVACLSLLQNGTFASGGLDQIKIWDTSRCRSIYFLRSSKRKTISSAVLPSKTLECPGTVLSLKELPNGQLASICFLGEDSSRSLFNSEKDDRRIYIWDTTMGTLLRTINVKCCYSLIVLPNGKLAIGQRDSISIVDPCDGTLLRTLKTEEQPIYAPLALLSNGQMVSVDMFANIFLWERFATFFDSDELDKEKEENVIFGERLMNSVCSICMEKIYYSRRKIVITHCGHLFCKTCFDCYLWNTIQQKQHDDYDDDDDDDDDDEIVVKCPYCSNKKWEAQELEQKYVSNIFV